MRLLLSCGANIEDRHRNGNTPLMQGAYGDGYEAPERGRLLLAKGADLSARNNKGQPLSSSPKTTIVPASLLCS